MRLNVRRQLGIWTHKDRDVIGVPAKKPVTRPSLYQIGNKDRSTPSVVGGGGH